MKFYWYTAGKWYYSQNCMKTASKKKTKPIPKDDGVFNYTTAPMFAWLLDLVRHDALRENDDLAMVSHW